MAMATIGQQNQECLSARCSSRWEDHGRKPDASFHMYKSSLLDVINPKSFR